MPTVTKQANYQTFLFDWDGTSARSLNLWLDALKRSLEQAGHSLTDKQIGANYEDFKKRASSLGVENPLEIIYSAQAWLSTQPVQTVLYDNAIDILRYLKLDNKTAALVTTSSHTQVDPVLAQLGITELFDAVVCREDTKLGKPDAEPLNLALKLVGKDKSSAVMIGDSDTDIKAANRAGMDSILVFPVDHHKFYELKVLLESKPSQVIHNLRGIKDVCDGI